MNWNLGLNAILLVAVVFVLMRMFKKKEVRASIVSKPSLDLPTTAFDDIIAVRKLDDVHTDEIRLSPATVAQATRNTPAASAADKTLLLFLLAKPQRQLAGYEMLQTILATGLRFGEGQLFHRHQHQNGDGPILCSLAAATNTGTFDLQNIGAFSAKGLCLYMNTSGDAQHDTDRLEKMLETAEQLAEGLDTLLLDEQRKPFTPHTKARYYQSLSAVN